MNNTQYSQEAAPSVPSADPIDGLLQTAALSQAIAVNVLVPQRARSGDRLQLTLDNMHLESAIINADQKPGDLVELLLNSDFLKAEKTYRLAYRIYYQDSDSVNISEETPLRVDRTSPGAALLAPLIVPNFTVGNRLTALLPGYAGMEPGDTIQTLCNGHPGPTHIVQPDELTLRPIKIVFEREVMQSLAADNVAISYTVTDRAGNLSNESLPVNLSVNM